MAEVQAFTGPQVAELVNLTYDTIDYWASTGIKQPSISDPKGTGKRRAYSIKDAFDLMVAAKFKEQGINTNGIKRILNCLKHWKLNENNLSCCYLIYSKDKVFTCGLSEFDSIPEKTDMKSAFVVMDLCIALKELKEGIEHISK